MIWKRFAHRTEANYDTLVSWLEYDYEEIDLSKGRPNKDFGRGFYVTTIKEQAEKMARRVARIYGGEPYVTVFEIDEDQIIPNGQ